MGAETSAMPLVQDRDMSIYQFEVSGSPYVARDRFGDQIPQNDGYLESAVSGLPKRVPCKLSSACKHSRNYQHSNLTARIQPQLASSSRHARISREL